MKKCDCPWTGIQPAVRKQLRFLLDSIPLNVIIRIEHESGCYDEAGFGIRTNGAETGFFTP